MNYKSLILLLTKHPSLFCSQNLSKTLLHNDTLLSDSYTQKAPNLSLSLWCRLLQLTMTRLLLQDIHSTHTSPTQHRSVPFHPFSLSCSSDGSSHEHQYLTHIYESQVPEPFRWLPSSDPACRSHVPYRSRQADLLYMSADLPHLSHPLSAQFSSLTTLLKTLPEGKVQVLWLEMVDLLRSSHVLPLWPLCTSRKRYFPLPSLRVGQIPSPIGLPLCPLLKISEGRGLLKEWQPWSSIAWKLRGMCRCGLKLHIA